MKYKETILWAVKVGDEDWQEQIITTDESKINEASNWAKENGYDRLRVAVIDLGVKPDFPGTINKFEMGGEINDNITSDFKDYVKNHSKKESFLYNNRLRNSRFITPEQYEINRDFIISNKSEDGTMYKRGGVVGQEIVFDDGGEENTGVIQEVNEITGDYIVDTDDGRTVLAQHEIDVISLGEMRNKSKDKSRKKLFGLFEDGGNINKSNNDPQFISYKNDEIMYVPYEKKYYANDMEFDSLEDAQKFLDSGGVNKHLMGAYKRGLFEDGGNIEPYKFAEGGNLEDSSVNKLINDQINYIINLKSVSAKKEAISVLMNNVDDWSDSMTTKITKDNLKYALQQKTIGKINEVLKTSLNAIKYAKGGNVDNSFDYMMLDRLRSDNDAFLYGSRNESQLWAGNVKDQISEMKTIWNRLKVKPEWLSMEDILDYEEKMTNKFAKGGSVNSNLKDSTYIPNRDIVSITIKKDGKNVKLTSKDILDGIYYKGVVGSKSTFEVDDIVYNTRTKTVGLVRLKSNAQGETKTDADGNVNTSELEIYNPIKFTHQKDAKASPSTTKEIDSRGLYNPYSIDESKKSLDTLKKIKVNGLNGWMPGVDYVYYDKVSKSYFFYFKSNDEILELRNEKTLAELDKFLDKNKMAKEGVSSSTGWKHKTK